MARPRLVRLSNSNLSKSRDMLAPGPAGEVTVQVGFSRNWFYFSAIFSTVLAERIQFPLYGPFFFDGGHNIVYGIFPELSPDGVRFGTDVSFYFFYSGRVYHAAWHGKIFFKLHPFSCLTKSLKVCMGFLWVRSRTVSF